MTANPFSFGSDNHSGVHPLILESLLAENQGHAPAYGTDKITQLACSNFKKYVHPSAETLFVFNGTAANVVALKSLVQSHQSILATDCSHVHNDECGAPEKIIGSKILPIKSIDGKICLDEARKFLTRPGDQHYSHPGALTITLPTEVGTCYSLDELRAIRDFCTEFELKLHIDGARFCLAPVYLKVSAKEIIDSCTPDAISYGGTKNGLLYGEAVLFFKQDPLTMRYLRKQCMQLPSKMRFMATQFNTFFEKELYHTLPLHEHNMARQLENHIKVNNLCPIRYPVQANSVYPLLEKSWVNPLKKTSFFYVWEQEPLTARWMCSWDTHPDHIKTFCEALKAIQT